MNKFIEAIFPMYANHIYNKKVRIKIDNFSEEEEDVISNDSIKGDDIKFYKEHYSETFVVKDKLEDKAKTNIIGLTIAITLILGSSDIISAIYDKYSSTFMEWVVFGILSATVIYMISAGILAIQVLITNNKMYFVNIERQLAGEQTLISNYRSCTNLNQLQNTIRNNSIFTSYECIRNALFCLFLIFIFIIIPVKNSETTINEPGLIETNISSQYEFLYSRMAIDFIKTNNIQSTIEDTIINNIEKNSDAFNSNESVGIADNVNKIYIKYRLVDNRVDILLIEPINDSISPK
jgi:hypothetical protein